MAWRFRRERQARRLGGRAAGRQQVLPSLATSVGREEGVSFTSQGLSTSCARTQEESRHHPPHFLPLSCEGGFWLMGKSHVVCNDA